MFNENKIEQEKPPFLYHGSVHKDIEELEPRMEKTRDMEEGAQVFASPNLGIAISFTAETRSSGCFDDVPYVTIIQDREKFIQNDHGGHVYILPSDTFSFDPGKGLGQYEWTSKSKVKPVDTLEFSSSLDAMVENGVQVYFIDKETDTKIQESSDHGLSILQSLESENQRRGTNVKEL